MAALRQHDLAGVRIITMSGALDFDASQRLADRFDDMIEPGGRVVIDLSGVDVLTTPGISLLVKARQRLHDSGGRMALVPAGAKAMEVIRRCKLDTLLPIRASAEEAVAALKAE